MIVEVENLRLKVLLSQPLLQPQNSLSPRRSPAAGTGLDEPGVPHPEMQQTKQEGTFPFQAGIDGFLHIDCMRIPEQERTSSFQADIGVNPETTTVRVAARQEFAKLPMAQQQRGTALIEQNKEFDPGGSVSTIRGGGDTTILSPGRVPKHPLPGIGLHDPLHGGKLAPN